MFINIILLNNINCINLYYNNIAYIKNVYQIY